MMPEQSGEFPDHADRTAGVNRRVVQGKGRQIFRERLCDEVVALYVAVVCADMDFATERLQALQTEEFARRFRACVEADPGPLLSGKPLQMLQEKADRGNADAAGDQHDVFAMV